MVVQMPPAELGGRRAGERSVGQAEAPFPPGISLPDERVRRLVEQDRRVEKDQVLNCDRCNPGAGIPGDPQLPGAQGQDEGRPGHDEKMTGRPEEVKLPQAVLRNEARTLPPEAMRGLRPVVEPGGAWVSASTGGMIQGLKEIGEPQIDR